MSGANTPNDQPFNRSLSVVLIESMIILNQQLDFLVILSMFLSFLLTIRDIGSLILIILLYL